MSWLLKSEVFNELRAAMAGGFHPTTEQQAQFMAARGGPRQGGDTPSNYTAAGDVAQIGVLGVLMPRPSFLLWLLGYEQTSYSDIQRALALAASDNKIKRVSLLVDSPGGQVDGLFETLAALQAFNKPMTVSAACACSAAYAIAATAGKITATNPAAEFGSIGVACSVAVDDSTIDLASTEAPNKRPDPSTAEGKAVIVEYLDAVHELFADAIAQGRGTTLAAVNSGYGRGGTLLAGSAKAKGMIDGIAAPPKRSASRARSSATAELGPLTLEALELCEQAPSLDGLVAVAERMPVEGHSPGMQKLAALDLGDQVWARFSSWKTGKPLHEILGVPVTTADAEPDVGDMIIANWDAARAGEPLPYPAPVESFALPLGTDLGDLVADRICGIQKVS